MKKAVVNQIDEKEDTIKQIGANMVLTPVWCDAFFCALQQKVLILLKFIGGWKRLLWIKLMIKRTQ